MFDTENSLSTNVVTYPDHELDISSGQAEYFSFQDLKIQLVKAACIAEIPAVQAYNV